MVNLPYQRIREEDYWIYPIVLINIVCVGIAAYASVLQFRGPALVLAAIGIWFTSSKVRRDYGQTRARVHIAATIVAAGLLAWLIYMLTN